MKASGIISYYKIPNVSGMRSKWPKLKELHLFETEFSGADTIVSFLPIVVLLGVFALILLRSNVWTNQKTCGENDRITT